MTSEQIEYEITRIIRAECERHGHRVTFVFEPDCGETLMMTSLYFLTERLRARIALCEALSVYAVLASAFTLGAQCIEINPVYHAATLVGTLVACLALHAVMRRQPHATIDEWMDHVHGVLWEHGYEISQRDDRTVIGYRV